MGITAGMLVQNTLKYLLNFGEVSDYLGYNAMNDFFPKMSLKPNPQCDDRHCLARQKDFVAKPKPVEETPVVEDVHPLHDGNEWGIELVDDSQSEGTATKSEETSGQRLAYEAPAKSENGETNTVQASADVNLDDLMAQMKSM